MSRITDSIKALKMERRTVARNLRQIDGLLSHFETLTADAPRRPRTKAKSKPVVKPKVAAKPRPRPRNNVILASKTASLASAAQD